MSWWIRALCPWIGQFFIFARSLSKSSDRVGRFSRQTGRFTWGGPHWVGSLIRLMASSEENKQRPGAPGGGARPLMKTFSRHARTPRLSSTHIHTPKTLILTSQIPMGYYNPVGKIPNQSKFNFTPPFRNIATKNSNYIQ